MGNQSTKTNSISHNLMTYKCPGRNRSVISSEPIPGDQDDRNNRSEFSLNKDFSSSTELLGRSWLDQTKNEEITRNWNELAAEHKRSSLKKRRRKKKLGHIREQSVCNSSEEETLNTNRKTREQNPIVGKSRQSSKDFRKEKNSKLIGNILKTLGDLEETFLEERKYERNLFLAIAKQIEELQRLGLSLHTEKERNKKLMELMNHENEVEEKYESHQIVERPFTGTDINFPAYTTNATMSPLLMQQRLEELSNSYTTCQQELKRKTKLLTLSQCTQEELQSKCDLLTGQVRDSDQKIVALNKKLADLKKEKMRMHKDKILKFNSETESVIGLNFREHSLRAFKSKQEKSLATSSD